MNLMSHVLKSLPSIRSIDVESTTTPTTNRSNSFRASATSFLRTASLFAAFRSACSMEVSRSSDFSLRSLGKPRLVARLRASRASRVDPLTL